MREGGIFQAPDWLTTEGRIFHILDWSTREGGIFQSVDWLAREGGIFQTFDWLTRVRLNINPVDDKGPCPLLNGLRDFSRDTVGDHVSSRFPAHGRGIRGSLTVHSAASLSRPQIGEFGAKCALCRGKHSRPF